MSEIVTEIVKVTTTGSAGSATGSGSTPSMNGFLLDINLNFHASAPATTDTTVVDHLSNSLLVVTSSVTDAHYAPRQTEHDGTGTSLGAGAIWPLSGPLTVSLAQCDALTNAVVATIRYLRG